jgi:hypothetical protein
MPKPDTEHVAVGQRERSVMDDSSQHAGIFWLFRSLRVEVGSLFFKVEC